MRPPLLLLLLVVLGAARAAASDLDEVKRRFIAMNTGEGADAGTPEVRSALDGLCATGRGLASSLGANGRWSDLAYDDPPAGPGWSIGDHYARTRLVAQAWRTPECTGVFGDAATAQKVERALAAAQPYFCGPCPKSGNWWWWNIGVPLSLAPTLVLMEGAIDAQVFSAALAALDANVAAQLELSGANLTDHAFNTLLIAVLKQDAGRAAAASREMDQTCLVTPHGLPYVEEDGIKSDFSFHQHQGQLSTGAYGHVFVDDVARYAALTDGTAFAMSPASLSTFTEFAWFGTTWSLYGDDYDSNVIGRGVSREGNHAAGALGALLRLALRPSPRQPELLAAAKQLLGSWRHGFSLEQAPLVAQVTAAPGDAGWPSGHRHYPDSDFTVHRRAGWYASVRMLSTRMISGENVNLEGKRGSRQSDGRLVLLLDGGEYAGPVMPTLDWRRLPGITVELTPNAADATYAPGVRTFVGGTGNGVRGVSAMDFAPPVASGSQLTVKKSWFFFDDAIVFLAAGVNCPSTNDVQTIVEQWPLSAIDSPLTVDGEAMPVDAGWSATLDAGWMTFDGLGAWFPGGAPVSVSRELRSGRWSDLGVGRDTLLEQPMLTVWVDHGAAPDGGSAAYALVPDVDATRMAAWAAAAPLTVISNTPQLAAVKDTRTNELGVVFWRGGSFENLSTNAALVAFVNDDGGAMRLDLAEPTQLREDVTVTVAGSWAVESTGADVQASATDAGLKLVIPTREGKTVTSVLTRVAPPVEPTKPPRPGCGCDTGLSADAAALALVLLRRSMRRRYRRGGA